MVTTVSGSVSNRVVADERMAVVVKGGSFASFVARA